MTVSKKTLTTPEVRFFEEVKFQSCLVTCFVSVFAGRVADTGIDPVPMMQEALELLKNAPNAELLWASPREVLNVYQAEDIGSPIITATNDILKKLDVFSQETVQMFFNDAQAAGFQL